MGWLELLLKFGSLAVIDQQMILPYSIYFVMKFICWQNIKNVKVSIILSQTQTRQKRDGIFKK